MKRPYSNCWRPMASATRSRDILGIDKDRVQFVMRWVDQEKPHHDKPGWFTGGIRCEPVAWQNLPASTGYLDHVEPKP